MEDDVLGRVLLGLRALSDGRPSDPVAIEVLESLERIAQAPSPPGMPLLPLLAAGAVEGHPLALTMLKLFVWAVRAREKARTKQRG